jgi:hypothetical protein
MRAFLEPVLVMGNGKHVGRKTSRIVRTPATRLGYMQKRLRKGPLPTEAIRLAGRTGLPKKHK